MKKYIEQETAVSELNRIEKLYRDTYMSKVRAEMTHYCCEVIKHIPAADVVEVDVKDLRVKKAIQTLCEFYSTAKKSDYVQKPLAWALYQTWKSFDKMDGGVNDGKID